MKYSKSLMTLLEKFEGCELKAYQDQGGVWTIGYGHTLNVHEGQTITLQDAEIYAQSDCNLAEAYVNELVKVPLSQYEFDALVDFVFNLGCKNFKYSTLLELLNKGEYNLAAEQFDRWDRCGGKIVAGLLRRRTAEQELFEGKENA